MTEGEQNVSSLQFHICRLIEVSLLSLVIFQSSVELAFYDVSVDWDGLTVRVEPLSQ